MNSVTRIIRSESDYTKALQRVAALITAQPAVGSADRDELELLSILIEDYERKARPPIPPDPVDAIEFRMSQMGLRQADLVPILGARSRVSEILSRKRPLSLEMMRALNRHLGIPWESLASGQSPVDEDEVAKSLPIAQMKKLGWLSLPVRHSAAELQEAIRSFFSPVGGPAFAHALYRQGAARIRSEGESASLAAWTTELIRRGVQAESRAGRSSWSLTVEELPELARLSSEVDGVSCAKQWLNTRGIMLVYLPHLAGTHLDGAVASLPSGRPVIGVTGRYDRLDNFWFTLLHECVHAALHIGHASRRSNAPILDDLDIVGSLDPIELEADAYASDALVPEAAWSGSPVRIIPSPPTVRQLAAELRVHPSVVAGRARRERRDYRLLTGLIGQGEVRVALEKLSREDEPT